MSLASSTNTPVNEKDTATPTTMLGNKESADSVVPPPVMHAPVSFIGLYRFATMGELILNFVGLVAAAGAGAAQPLMTLLFGNLTNAFVDFGRAAVEAFLPGAGQAEMAALDAAANRFRDISAEDALYITIIGIGMFLATWLYMAIWSYTGEVQAKRIRESYLKAVLRQDVAYFDNVGAGEVATRIQNDTHLVQQGISEKIPTCMSFVGSFVGGFIIAYIRSWKLSLAITSIVPCMIILGGFLSLYISKFKVSQLGHMAEGGSIAEEILSSIRTAQAFGSQLVLSNKYNSFVDKSHVLENKVANVVGVISPWFQFVIFAGYALAFYFGTTLILSGEIDAGTLINVFMAILIGSFSLVMLAPELQTIATASGAAAKLFATMDRVPAIDSADPSGEKPVKVIGAITLEGVKFRYPARPDVPILKGLDISFAPGKTSALVGASGSGKSTIVSLVERFYDPIEGAIKLDGINLKNLNLKWLRQQIGLVSQEPILFATTIRKNVEHGLIGHALETASDEERFEAVKQACVKANADGFISKLPLGYETLVGERGFLLSGGQKQRIAIARAIVSDPPILLLDEATSALDTQSEEVVQNALDKASRGRTTIAIAHRLSTVKDADQIYVMGEGMVLEQGTHNELLADAAGPYARLVQAQKLREAEQLKEDNSGTSTPAPDDVDRASIASETIPGLGRSSTNRSLASEILKQKQLAAEESKIKYGTLTMAKRMVRVNPSAVRLYAIGSIGALIGGMVTPVIGIIFASAMEGFQKTGSELRRAGDRNALWFFVIAIVATLAGGIQTWNFVRAASNLTHQLRRMVFAALLRQDIAYFDDDKHSTGQLTSDLNDGPQKIMGLAGMTLGAIAQSVVTVIGGAIIGLVYGWKLALVGIACVPFVIGSGYVRLRVVTLKDAANKESHAEAAQLACEAAGSIRTVASLTREQDCSEMYSKSLELPLQRTNRSMYTSTAFYALSQAMAFFVISLVFWYGSRLVASLEYDTRQFFVCLMSVTFSSVQAGSVFAFVPDISESQSASRDILTLLDNEPEVDAESTDGKIVSNCQGKIEIREAHFRYPTRPAVRVLRNFNLIVAPGTHVALVGASGCGKSTIIQLIERFYDPLHGTVLVDDEPIDQLNVQEYRKHLALVSQEPTLYAGTVRFNILLGATKPHDQVTQEEIEAACRDANILDFIQSLPQGFETEVGGKGSQLSGGQKQRIAIARALIRNPRILLLDEATSALDSNSERVVQDALDRAAKGRTTISIAHRLSTIQKCDQIHFVQEGRIVESGTHDELLRKRGLYAEYVLLQDLSTA